VSLHHTRIPGRETVDPLTDVREAYVPFRGFRTWYRMVGTTLPGKLPLLCLHGGPGAAHDYLEPLEEMAETGRAVVFYDQLGCGNSDQPHDPRLWTIGLYLEEVGAVRRTLGLDRIHLLGQSWGGMLAMEYALTQPEGLISLTVASSPASMLQWVSEANKLRAELPVDVRKTLDLHERTGTTDDPAYQEAVMVYYRRHLIRTDPWPDHVNRTFDQLARNPEVYHTMNGPSEFFVTGTLKDWDITGRLGEIRLPTLITSGLYDEATPAIAETVHKGIPDSKCVLFKHSGHMAHSEEKEEYLRALNSFLSEVEARLPLSQR
jgi:proline-specific peptidase